MDLKKLYGSNGKLVNIIQMIQEQPKWAANRIQDAQKFLDELVVTKTKLQLNTLKLEDYIKTNIKTLKHTIDLLQKVSQLSLADIDKENDSQEFQDAKNTIIKIRTFLNDSKTIDTSPSLFDFCYELSRKHTQLDVQKKTIEL